AALAVFGLLAFVSRAKTTAALAKGTTGAPARQAHDGQRRSLKVMVAGLVVLLAILAIPVGHHFYSEFQQAQESRRTQENIQRLKIEGDAQIRKIERISKAQMQKHP